MRKAIWIGGGVLVVAAGVYAVAKPTRDEFEALRPYITKDETHYYSATDLSKAWGPPGAAPAPLLHNSSYREIELSPLHPKELMDAVDKIARNRNLAFFKPGYQSISYTYTSAGTAGMVGEQDILSTRAQNVRGHYIYGLGASLPALAKLDDKISARILDIRVMSFWDEVKVRVKNKGRVPFTDPAK